MKDLNNVLSILFPFSSFPTPQNIFRIRKLKSNLIRFLRLVFCNENEASNILFPNKKNTNCKHHFKRTLQDPSNIS